jgi:ribonuclease HII
MEPFYRYTIGPSVAYSFTILDFSQLVIIGLSMSLKYIIGIDEVGRGPLAGPVCVGLCAIKKEKLKQAKKLFKNFKDSKQLREEQRYIWLEKIKFAEKQGFLYYTAQFSSEKIIDKKGISFAIKSAMNKCIDNFGFKSKDVEMLLDGSLYAPDNFKNQKTIIKGDEKELPIALASIVAKIKRDEFMKKIAESYPGYGFEVHKGYGTKSHREMILKNGPSKIHRLSFLKKILERDRI